MHSLVSTVDHYIQNLPDDRKSVLSRLRTIINSNLPSGFEEMINYGMIGYVVPHSIYPSGYHCNTKLPLPFINLASQKNFIALYHMGLYANPKLLDWFKNEFPNYSKAKLDMGKSCIRFKKMDQIPFELIGELVQKMTCEDWIKLYENQLKK
ncbi:MAG: DUF1801 domain-containing protein [Bacteroidetes bacterium]|nr:DUF1801 domain-containing protein [Bacteroidota bacterium]NCQ11100.1 DUF1801 domain-containing protein [Bacteroidota bacterium]